METIKFFQKCQDSRKQKSATNRGAFVVRAEGLEPPTSWFEATRSIQLSYARIFLEQRNHNANIDVRQRIQYYFDAHASVAQR